MNKEWFKYHSLFYYHLRFGGLLLRPLPDGLPVVLGPFVSVIMFSNKNQI